MRSKLPVTGAASELPVSRAELDTLAWDNYIQTKHPGTPTINHASAHTKAGFDDSFLHSSQTASDNGGIHFEFRSTDVSGLEVPNGVVRVKQLEDSHLLTHKSEDAILVQYTVDSDPGGRLPKCLVKQASRELSYITLKNLQERAEKGVAAKHLMLSTSALNLISTRCSICHRGHCPESRAPHCLQVSSKFEVTMKRSSQ